MSNKLETPLCGGKYKYIREEDCSSRVLRYGECWRDTTGDNVIHCMAGEIERLRGLIPSKADMSELLAAKLLLAKLVYIRNGWEHRPKDARDLVIDLLKLWDKHRTEVEESESE